MARTLLRDDAVVGVQIGDPIAPAPDRSFAPAPSDDPITRDGLALLLREVLVDVLEAEDGEVADDADFFDDMGADSMVMALFCAKLRKRDELPSPSIKEVYAHPTIDALVDAFATDPADGDAAAATADAATEAAEPWAAPAPAAPMSTPPHSSWWVAWCGAMQLLIGLELLLVGAVVASVGFDWVSAATGQVDTFLRALWLGLLLFVGSSLLPIVAKWLLVGRFRAGSFPVWGPAYVRFWLVKLLITRSPLATFAGSPIFPWYLRLLGARVGKNVVFLSRSVPACPDLLTIGDHAVVRQEAVIQCYRAEAGRIVTGRVRIGDRALVGERALLDIDTTLGDDAQLGHASSLHPGQSVPDGARVVGSPAQDATDVDYRDVEPAGHSRRNRIAFSVAQVAFLLAVSSPLLVSVVFAIGEWRIFVSGGEVRWWGTAVFREALVLSLVLYFAPPIVRYLLAVTVPRLFHRAFEVGRVYPLYGVHHWMHRAVGRLTNLRFFTRIVGDSSYITPFLRTLGYHARRGPNTGADFGQDVKHDDPFLVHLGRGTMVADGISFVGATYSSTSFTTAPVEVGDHSFFGNDITYPADARTGEDCLHATKVVVPLDGEVREGIGFLGSPCFEIPRSVMRDHEFDHLTEGAEFERRLRAKNRHNLVSMVLHVVARWGGVFITSFVLLNSVDVYRRFGPLALAVVGLTTVAVASLYRIGVERLMVRWMNFEPMHCSMYERRSWQVERFWKLTWESALFDGTPFKSTIMRLLGVRIGRRHFDDGAFYTERRLITVGDDCTFNAGTVVQPHSQEDGNLKLDRIEIGSGCTVGIGTLVHYGTTVGDHAVIGSDAFLMKGSNVPPRTHWAENPARELDTR